MIKKTYEIADTVWIYGVARQSNRLSKGKIIHKFTLESHTEVQYVVSVPTSIEPLLEIREWSTISQDSTGPVGALREMISEQEMDASNKKMAQAGFEYDVSYETPEVQPEENEPTPDEIHAALERGQKSTEHAPLVLKEARPKRKFYPRKKKQ
jgi:hypothetical protein